MVEISCLPSYAPMPVIQSKEIRQNSEFGELDPLNNFFIMNQKLVTQIITNTIRKNLKKQNLEFIVGSDELVILDMIYNFFITAFLQDTYKIRV